jgi:hypothetical protein
MRRMRRMPTRRELIGGACAASAMTVLIGALRGSRAWAGGRPEELDRWAREVVAANERVGRGELDVLGWQKEIARVHATIEVPALVRYLDLEQLTRELRFGGSLAETVDPILPAAIAGGGSRPGSGSGPRRWFIRVFGLRKGGAIIPHVHNAMVSAHLVVAGSFHARTYDRVRDLADAAVLRPSIDRELSVGDLVTMSDRRDNGHWLIARAARAMTLDVGVVDVAPSWKYGLPANRYSMIFVDADRRPEADGTIVAPTLTFERCVAKYAP